MPQRIKRTKLPDPGTVFTKTFKGQTLKAKVIAVDRDRGRISLEVNGVEYPSPTAAAKAFTKNDVNGWVFWGIEPR